MNAKEIAHRMKELAIGLSRDHCSVGRGLTELAYEVEKLSSDPEPSPVHSVGNRYRHEGGDEYILVIGGAYTQKMNPSLVNPVSGYVQLSNLESGLKWCAPEYVHDCLRITPDDLSRVMRGYEKDFTLIHQAGEQKG